MVIIRHADRTGTSACPSCSGGAAGSGDAAGASLIEVAVVLAIVSCMFGVGLPILAHSTDARRVRDAAGLLAGQFRMARQQAVMTGRHTAVVFEDVAGDIGWRMCEDLDRDGVSREDIGTGLDRCEEPVQVLSVRFPYVRVGYAPGVPSLTGETGVSPLRFGVARMAVFTPAGTASSGTIALLGEGGHQFMVRVAGVTGRTRVLRFDSGRRAWLE